MTSPAGLPPGVAPEPVPVRRKRGRPRDPEADRRILDAAAALILAHGFDNMTVDDVAARAHVGKATVYRRWAKKEDLAVAAMGQLYDAQMPTPDTGSIEGDLREAFAKVLAFANSEQGSAYIRTCIAESVRDPRIAALYRAANDRAEDSARMMFQRAIARGEVRQRRERLGRRPVHLRHPGGAHDQRDVAPGAQRARQPRRPRDPRLRRLRLSSRRAARRRTRTGRTARGRRRPRRARPA